MFYLFVLDGEGKLIEKTTWLGDGVVNDETLTPRDGTVRPNAGEECDCFPSTCGGMGGGIDNDGALTVTSSTVSGNAGSCGGVRQWDPQRSGLDHDGQDWMGEQRAER